MDQWNPLHFSTPLDKAMRPVPGQGRMPDLSVITGSPNFDMSPIARPPRQSSLYPTLPSSSATKRPASDKPTNPILKTRDRMAYRQTSNDNRLSTAHETSFSSLLAPRNDDEVDNTFYSADMTSMGLPSLTSGEKVSLEQASGYLQDCIKKDQMKLDIADQLVGTNAAATQYPSASGAHPDDYVPSDVSHFRIAQEFALDDIVSRALNENQSGYRGMGSFPALRMAYAFVETKLYVWSWENARNLTTIEYPEFVTAVGLLSTLSPGLLHYGAPFVVVVTTLTEVLFSNVTASEGSYVFQTGEFSLRTSTNDQRFNKIQTTREGRVFLGGMEGQVCELQNIKQNTFSKWLWFGPKLANCTLAVYERIATALPGFHLLFRKEPVTQMIMDETRKILYTLRKDNNVDLYDLGATGTASVRHIHLSFQNIVNQALPLLRNVDRLQIKQIVSVHPVDTWESTRYPFFLLTSTGLRLFFSIVYRGTSRDFVLGHIRFPPGHNPSAPISQVTSHLTITDSFYAEGTTLMVAPGDGDEQDDVVSSSSDLYIYDEKFRESVSVLSIPYRIEAVQEVPQFAQDSLSLQSRSLALNQLMTFRKVLVISTFKKCYLVEKSYPVDIMERVLRTHNPMSAQVREFIEWLPPFQSCFLALHLACVTTSGEIAKLATKILRVYGGDPVVEQEATATTGIRSPRTFPPTQTPSPQRPSSTPRSVIVYSAKHDAFYFLFSRIIAPLWNVHPFVFGAEFKGGIAWISGIPQTDIQVFIDQLSLVKRYLETHWNELFYPHRRMNQQGLHQGLPSEDAVVAINATKVEMVSVKSLAALMDNTMQLLRLWEFLLKEGLTQILDYVVKVYNKETLMSVTFSELLVNPTGRAVVDAIIKAIHQRYLDEGTDTQSVLKVSSYLQDICPKLFDQDDAITMKVLTVIDKAKTADDKSGARAMLETALELVRPNATIMGLREIVDRLTESGFYEAAAEICGLAALQADPQNYAVRFVINNETTTDSAGKAAMEKRQKYYGMITRLLSELDALASPVGGRDTLLNSSGMNGTVRSNGMGNSTALSRGLRPADARSKLEFVLDWIYTHSSDVLLHFSIFEWCFSMQLDRYAMASSSPYLKDYLIRKLTSIGQNDVETSVRFLKLMAECAERQGDLWNAAKALSEMALHEKAQIRITERVEALTRISMLCQTLELRGYAQALAEFLGTIKVNFALAKLQQEIYNYVEDRTFDVTVSAETRAKLTFDLLNANKLFEVANEIEAPQWTLVVMSLCGEPAKASLIVHVWKKFVRSALEYAKRKNLKRERRLSLIADEVNKIRGHLSPADQYCALDLIVEAFESVYASMPELSSQDPIFMVECIVDGFDQDIASVVDVYQSLLEKYASDTVLAQHLLRVHSIIVDTLIEDNGRSSLSKERRRFILNGYVKKFDGYLRSAMRLQLPDAVLVQLQDTAQRLALYK